MTSTRRRARDTVAVAAAAVTLACGAAGCADAPTESPSVVSFPSPSYTRPAVIDPVVTPSPEDSVPAAAKDWSTGLFAFSSGPVVAVVQFPCPSSNPFAAALELVRQLTTGARLHVLAVTVRNTGSTPVDLAKFRAVTASGQALQLTPVADLIGQWITGDRGLDQNSYTEAVNLQRALPVLVPPGATITSLIATDRSIFNVTGVVYAGPSSVALVKVWTLRHGTAAQQRLWATAHQLVAQVPNLGAAQERH